MGSTVSTGKQAYAFVTPENKTAYVLFEESYEKNCHPHRPSWNCVTMGYLGEVMATVFRTASCCEGGILQHQSGHVLPEAYVQRWLDTLAEPLAMPDVLGKLAYSESFSATMPLSLRGKIEDSLRTSGLAGELETLDGRQTSLHKDFDLLRAIYGKCAIGLWRFLPNKPFVTGGHCKELGYAPPKLTKQSKFTPPKMARYGPENVFIVQENGEYKNGGWAYSVVGDFVRDYVETELVNPGSFKAAFKTFRKATETAEQLPETTQIEITVPTTAENDGYGRRQAMTVVNMFAPEQHRVTVSLGQVLEREKTRPNEGSHALHQVLYYEVARWFPASGEQNGTAQNETVQNGAVQLQLEIA
jgi:hypothetical protein